VQTRHSTRSAASAPRHRPRAQLGLLACLLAVGASASVLERGNGPEPSTLDAHRCPEVACGHILRDLYEGLVTEGPDGRPQPGMAASWTVSADGLHWRFLLRDGLSWSDGTPLDAGQIVASFQRALSPATAAPHAALLDAIVGAVALQAGRGSAEGLGVAAPNPATVEFTLTRPAPLLDLLLMPVAYPVHLPTVIAHGAQHTRPGRLLGNGAYRLRAWTPQASVELERNPYFRQPAPIARVRYHVTEDAAAELARYAAGELHVTETLPPGQLERLRTRFGPALRIAPYLGSFWFGFNLERPPFANAPALREALVLALDRERLTRSVTGLGETPAWGVVPPGMPGYAEQRPPWADWTQPQREARARAAYAEAGYGPSRPLRIELRFNTSHPHRRLALAVAAMWREVLGVQAVLRNEEWKVFVQNRRQRVITQVFRGGWIGDLADPANFLAAFAGDSALNWTGYRDPAFTALLEQSRLEADPAQRNLLLADAESRLQAAHAVIPLYHYASRHLVDPRLDGWVDNPLDRHPSRWLSFRDVGAAR
jgi:oligopeptide transport system substrate-binding protein